MNIPLFPVKPVAAMATLNEQFEVYFASIYPDGNVSPVQLAETKQAFFAGADTAITAVLESVDKPGGAEKLILQLHEEITHYNEQRIKELRKSN